MRDLSITPLGRRPVVVPGALVSSAASGVFDENTSYVARVARRLGQRAYRETALPSKLTCMARLRARAEATGGYETYADWLAGIGLCARVLGEGKSVVVLNDLDPGCRKVLYANFRNTTVSGIDVAYMPTMLADMVLLDFNNYTYKRRAQFLPVLARAFEAAQRYVVLNDCTPFYFRYGARSYEVYSRELGVEIGSVEEYVHAAGAYYMREYGWHIIHAAWFRESSFQLLARVEEELVVEEVGELDKLVIEGFTSATG